MADRKAILVLGMHRSGTSAVTRVLNMLGAALPRRLMPAAVANPVGHFEPMDIVNIHDDILRSAGTKWSDWSRFPQSWYESPHREAFVGEIVRAVRENYGDAGLFVVKDPRMARIVPIWTEALSTLGIEPVAVIPYRNPIEVAQSLSTRDRFTLGQGLLMWLRHCLDAEAETRGMPRCFVGYDRLVGESQSTAFRIMEALPIAWPRKTAQALSEISDFLDPKLHRQKVPLAGVQHPDVTEAVGETFASLARLAEDEADATARARLDAVRSDLDVTAAMAFAAFEGLTAEQQRLDRHVLDLGERFAQLAGEFSRVTAELQSWKEAAAASIEDRVRGCITVLQAADAAWCDEIRRLRLDVEASDAAWSDEIRRLRLGVEASDAARSTDIEGLRADLITEAAQWRADGASTDAEVDAVDERLRRLTGRVALEAFEAGRRSSSRFRRLRPRKLPGAEEREELRRFVLSSGLFDPDWYRARHGDAVPTVEDALDHYLSVGFERNYDPGPAFVPTWYLEANPDIREAGIPPLVHYVRSGIAEGRRGRPSPVAALFGKTESHHES